MSNDHEISVKITEETMQNMLEKNKDYINYIIVDKDTELEYSVDDLKDTVENLEYELQELKDKVDDDRIDSSDLKGDYNDLDDRLSELENKPFDGKGMIDGQNEFAFTLPHSKTKITYKLLDGHDEAKIKRELKGLKKINKNA